MLRDALASSIVVGASLVFLVYVVERILSQRAALWVRDRSTFNPELGESTASIEAILRKV